MKAIDDTVLRIFNDLPDPFKLSDVVQRCPSLNEHQIQYQLQVLADMDLIHKKGEVRIWTKTYQTVEAWFRAYVRKLQRKQGE